MPTPTPHHKQLLHHHHHQSPPVPADLQILRTTKTTIHGVTTGPVPVESGNENEVGEDDGYVDGMLGGTDASSSSMDGGPVLVPGGVVDEVGLADFPPTPATEPDPPAPTPETEPDAVAEEVGQ